MIETRETVDVVEDTEDVVVCDSCGQDANQFDGDPVTWYKSPEIVVAGESVTGRRSMIFGQADAIHDGRINAERLFSHPTDIPPEVGMLSLEVNHDGRVDLCPVCAEVIG